MVLFFEVLCIFILGMILAAVVFDELGQRAKQMRRVQVSGYWDGKERRSAERLNITFEVKYFTNGKGLNAKSMDVSTSGIRLVLDEKIVKGTPVRLELKIPDQTRPIKARGEVMWSDEAKDAEKTSPKRLFNTGLKFYALQKANEKILFDFIDSLRSRKA
ncbi:MAG: PilZ domain-containing protein [Candidatus Omnitrophica bacterium]|nr:PilZ domain-containing protein [Candidatus Omnitrophota bacterium]